MSESEKMYLYYSEKNILPTFCNFKTQGELLKYEEQRVDLISDKLNIPVQFFNDREILEFGPDSGENALIFAKWGAKLNFVEPNAKAINTLKNNFKNFHLEDKIKSISQSSLLDFKTNDKFDFIVAEGFINTIKPDKLWLEKISPFLKKNGLLFISYVNSYGSNMDLFYNFISIYMKKKVSSSVEYEQKIEKLFSSKWQSISHTRSFDSWRMDVLENPYARLKYTINPEEFLREAAENSLVLFSSWPSYKPKNNIYWHKSLKSDFEKLADILLQIKKDQLSYFFGFNCDISEESSEKIDCVNFHLINFMKAVDHCKDDFTPESINSISIALKKTINYLSNNNIGQIKLKKILESLGSILNLIFLDKIDSLIDFCNSDETFINYWGLPTHILVLKKIGS